MQRNQYTKLAAIIAEAIKNGNLPPGSKLPTHRSFAEQNGVALATATRAYRELERLGLIVGEKGRGVFVRDQGVPLTLGVEQTAAEGMIDLVFNIPEDPADPDTLRAGLVRLSESGDLHTLLRYQPHGGRPRDRCIVAAYLSQMLGPIPPERTLITSGGQHGLAITVLGLLRRGDAVGTDPLTYPGFKATAALHGLNLIPIESNDGCMDIDALEYSCKKHKLRAIYTMPTVHNPLGTVMDETTRCRLVDAARRHDLLIFEDSAYAFLEETPPPSLVSLAPERTVHIGGFSKNLATGLRLGYLVVPEMHMGILTHVIRATTWNSPALISALITDWIEDGTLAKSEENRRRDGAFRQRICREILHDLPIISHRHASFAWLPLMNGQRAEPIVTQLFAQGIAVSAADPFAVVDATPQALRLAFGGIPEPVLRDALEKVRDQLCNKADPQHAAGNDM